jgi:hypothetical protein
VTVLRVFKKYISEGSDSGKEKKRKLFVTVINYVSRCEDIRKSGGIAPPFLTSVLDVSEWLASRHQPVVFTPGEKAPSTQWIEGLMGPTVGLNAVEKRKSFAPSGNRTQVAQPVARRCTD